MGFFKKKKQLKVYGYTREEMEQYEKFIEDNFGEFSEVFHEIVSPDIHIDVIIVPPTDKDNFYKLITMGMGSYSMNLPDDLKNYELDRAELVLYLPNDWNIKSPKEEDYWPIRYLKVLPRLPITEKSWLGFGHTISSDQNNTPYAANTRFSAMMLLTALNLEMQELDLTIPTLGKINFYQMFPLYEEELKYKLYHSLDELMDKFDDSDIFPVINLNRPSYGNKIKDKYE